MHNLLPQSECEEAKVLIIHPEVSIFEAGPFRFQIQHDRFDAGTFEPQHYNALRDVVVGTFRLLRHSPIRMVGINRDLHFKSEGAFSWENVEGSVSKVIGSEGLAGGFLPRGLDMQRLRDDTYEGRIVARLEPSSKEKNGVYFGHERSL